MTLDHRHWADTQYDDDYRDVDGLVLNVEPDERVGAPLPDRRKARAKRLFTALVLIGGGWALVANVGLPGLVASAKSTYEVIAASAEEIAARAREQRPPEAAPAPQPDVQAAAMPAILPELVPTREEATPAAAETPPAEAMGTSYAAAPQPAEAPDSSPKRKTAIAAGLSPDLPNVLLTRLSKGDLSNAAYAIKTALAKTPDDKSFAWPAKPSEQQALFEVRFVPGAAEGCRRYIVTVTKDRWSSTSAALERCAGAQPQAG